MKSHTRVLAALSVVTIVGIAAGFANPPTAPTNTPAKDHGAKTRAIAPAKPETTRPKAPAAAKSPAERDDHAQTAGEATDSGEATHAGSSASSTERLTPEQALRKLEQGNSRWVAGSPDSPNLGAARRTETAEMGQTPFASVLTCADSRIPVEHVFDQGVGDLFVVRVAGNTAGLAQTGSLEYGVEHLHTPVLVVLGHTKCGAVSAAATSADVHGNIKALVETIGPSVERAQKLNPSLADKDLVPAAIRENVWQSIFDVLKSSGPCREAVAQGHLKVVGAVYDISTGKVEWLGEHPWQSELLAAFTKESSTREAAASEPHPDEH